MEDFLIARSLGATSFLVFTLLKQKHDGYRINEISKIVGISERMLRDTLPKLESFGVIHRTFVISEKGLHYVYRIKE